MATRAFGAVGLASWIAGCSSPAPGPETRLEEVRPLTIRVIDARTKKPLPGIPVSYVLRVMVGRTTLLGALNAPSIGPRYPFRKRARTDRRGEVTFQAGNVRLHRDDRTDERLDGEIVLVNLEADMSKRGSRLWLETLQSSCDDPALKRLCSGPPDDLDVAISAIHEPDEEERNELYRNPDPRRAGKLLFVLPSRPNAGYMDWTEADDDFAVQFHFSRSAGPEIATVELGPAPGARGGARRPPASQPEASTTAIDAGQAARAGDAHDPARIGSSELSAARISNVESGLASGASRDSYYSACAGFSLSPEQVGTFLRNARPGTLVKFNDEERWAPCVVRARLEGDGIDGVLEISAFYSGRVLLSNGTLLLLCDDECERKVRAANPG